jgi:SAM-dependent methyltransferase
VYFGCVFLAVRTIARGLLIEGLKLLWAPVGYWRFLPFGVVWQELSAQGHRKILDVGSPKILSLLLAAGGRADVWATDLDDEKIFSRWHRLGGHLGLGNYRVEYQDGRRLTYSDESFDFVFSISVIEHIPDDGDVAAIGEFYRVLKPNGVLVVEVPYRRQYEEIARTCTSKGTLLDSPQFYERHYDAEHLGRLQRAGLTLERKLILGEWVALDPLIATDRLPRPLRVLLLPLEPVLAVLNYWCRSNYAVGRPLAAVMVFRKDQSTPSSGGTGRPSAGRQETYAHA